MNKKLVASELLKVAKELVSEQRIPWYQELIDALGPQFAYQSRSNNDWAIFQWTGPGHNSNKVLTIAEDLIDRARLGDFHHISVEPKGKILELHINL